MAQFSHPPHLYAQPPSNSHIPAYPSISAAFPGFQPSPVPTFSQPRGYSSNQESNQTHQNAPTQTFPAGGSGTDAPWAGSMYRSPQVDPNQQQMYSRHQHASLNHAMASMALGDRDGRPSAASQRTEWQGSGRQQQGAAFIPPPVIPPPGPVFAHAQQQQSGTGVQVLPPPQADHASSYAPYAFSPPPAQPVASYAPPVPPTYAPYSYAPYAYAPYAYGPERPEPPAHNTVEMTREMLIAVLERFAEVLALPAFFGGPTGVKKLRLITHGGACMLLHPHLYGLSLNQPLTVDPLAPPPLPPSVLSNMNKYASGSNTRNMNKLELEPVPATLHMSTLPRRTTTRDVDVLLRAFVVDYGGYKLSIPLPPPSAYPSAAVNQAEQAEIAKRTVESVNRNEAAVKLREAVKKTAGWYFPASTSGAVATPALGADWMNADADVALPFGVDPATNQPFDPLHVSSLTPQNISLHTVYTSPNGFLELVSVPPYWSVALKLVRWGRRDWGDVGILLRNGTLLSNTQWTPATLRAWLESNCWAMGYARWDERKRMEMEDRMRQAIGMIEGWDVNVLPFPGSNTAIGAGSVNGSLMASHGAAGDGRDGLRDKDRTKGKNAERRSRSKSRARSTKSGHSGRYRETVEQREEEVFIPPEFATVQARGARSKSRPRSSHSGGSGRVREEEEVFIPPEFDEFDYGGHYGATGFESRDRYRERGRSPSRARPAGTPYRAARDIDRGEYEENMLADRAWHPRSRDLARTQGTYASETASGSRTSQSHSWISSMPNGERDREKESRRKGKKKARPVWDPAPILNPTGNPHLNQWGIPQPLPLNPPRRDAGAYTPSDEAGSAQHNSSEGGGLTEDENDSDSELSSEEEALYRAWGVEGRRDGQNHIYDYSRSVPGVSTYVDQTKKQAMTSAEVELEKKRRSPFDWSHTPPVQSTSEQADARNAGIPFVPPVNHDEDLRIPSTSSSYPSAMYASRSMNSAEEARRADNDREARRNRQQEREKSDRRRSRAQSLVRPLNITPPPQAPAHLPNQGSNTFSVRVFSTSQQGAGVDRADRNRYPPFVTYPPSPNRNPDALPKNVQERDRYYAAPVLPSGITRSTSVPQVGDSVAASYPQSRQYHPAMYPPAAAYPALGADLGLDPPRPGPSNSMDGYSSSMAGVGARAISRSMSAIPASGPAASYGHRMEQMRAAQDVGWAPGRV